MVIIVTELAFSLIIGSPKVLEGKAIVQKIKILLKLNMNIKHLIYTEIKLLNKLK